MSGRSVSSTQQPIGRPQPPVPVCGLRSPSPTGAAAWPRCGARAPPNASWAAWERVAPTVSPCSAARSSSHRHLWRSLERSMRYRGATRCPADRGTSPSSTDSGQYWIVVAIRFASGRGKARISPRRFRTSSLRRSTRCRRTSWSTARPSSGGRADWTSAHCSSDTLDVVCAAVIGPRTRPTELVAGLPVDGRLQMVGRTTPLGAKASRELGGMLSAPLGGHPWPETVKPAALDRFSGSRQAIALTLVEPVVVEVSADVAWSGRSFRHPLRFVRVRPEMTPVDVELPAFLKRS